MIFAMGGTSHSSSSSVIADLAELARRERLGEDAGVDQAEGVPFGGSFGFKLRRANQHTSTAKHYNEDRSKLTFQKIQPCVLRSKTSICASM